MFYGLRILVDMIKNLFDLAPNQFLREQQEKQKKRDEIDLRRNGLLACVDEEQLEYMQVH